MSEDEHFPWHYTAYGVECVCGEPIVNDRDECRTVAHAAHLAAQRPTPAPTEES